MRHQIRRCLELMCLLLVSTTTFAQVQETRSAPPEGGSTAHTPKVPGKPPKGTEGIATADTSKEARQASGKGGAIKPEKTAYDYELPGMDGKAIKLNSFKGEVVLVVNLGRNSSYNSQLPALEKLSETYKSKGLAVVGVPSNEFGAAEPGTDAEIQKTYADAKVTFPVTPVSTLTGVQALPLFSFMTKGKAVPPGGPVHWNYTKFLIDRKGKVVARFEPDVAPDSPELLTTVDQVIDGTFKPRKDEPKEDAGGEDDEGP